MEQPPRGLAGRAALIGPGLIAAATGVGAGDIVAALAAGARLGMALLWAVVIGAVLKFALAEGVGRWHLASGTTILSGWRAMGSWTMVYFGIYIMIWGFSFGAAAMSATALPLNALFPALSVRAWGIIAGLVGFVLVGVGRYRFFERLMTVLVGVMFITVVGSAVMVATDVESFAAGLRPQLPADSVVYVLGLLGGIGGSITLAAYGYWLREKGWRRPEWLPVMRLDNGVAYVITGIFVVAMLVVGTALLFGTGQDIGGEEGLVSFSDQLQQRLGGGVRLLFLIGFFSAAATSLLGVWNGVSLLFADFVRVARGVPDAEADAHVHEASPTFRFYLAWLTFPPMALLFLDQPVALVLVYTALGAIFMPYLAATLLWLLNRDVDPRYRNGWASNLALGASAVLFVIIAINEIAAA
ncbi:MAG TPA: Nramp family divalent metal transporter [Euzebyales bacterium]|nr:Nramp family divalent metal transporter [Euzebyales bacterium]